MERLLELIKQRSKSDQGSQADRKPPDEVDPERKPGLQPEDRLSTPDGDVPIL
jgi:hypothetical protein